MREARALRNGTPLLLNGKRNGRKKRAREISFSWGILENAVQILSRVHVRWSDMSLGAIFGFLRNCASLFPPLLISVDDGASRSSENAKGTSPRMRFAVRARPYSDMRSGKDWGQMGPLLYAVEGIFREKYWGHPFFSPQRWQSRIATAVLPFFTIHADSIVFLLSFFLLFHQPCLSPANAKLWPEKRRVYEGSFNATFTMADIRH